MNCFKKIAVFLLTLFAAASVQGAAVIKFATLAPEGSTWMKIMREWDAELAQKTGGELKFRFYPGGISGDEKDVVKKIRFGQLHSAGFTGVGLGEIAPEARVLDAPFLFKDAGEADHVYQAFNKELHGAFEKNGYVLLGWAEVGFIYFFSNTPVKGPDDLKGIKMWMWEGDPIAEASFKAMGVNPVPLSITDVMTSLQTGLIDGVYSSPLGILALQWFTKTKYMCDFHLADASGAVLISRKFFDSLPKDQQDILISSGRKHLSRLTALSRAENLSAIETLKKNGIQITSVKFPEDIQKYREMGRRARRALVGRLYSEDLLNRVEKSLQEFRAKKK